MTPEEFVAAVKQVAFDSAVAATMKTLQEGPPGRGPQPRGSALNLWFRRLPAADQQMVMECVRDAAHSALFGLLCVLDGVRVIDDPPHVDLHLTATNSDGITTTVTSRWEPFELHDEFNGLVHPPSERSHLDKKSPSGPHTWPSKQDRLRRGTRVLFSAAGRTVL